MHSRDFASQNTVVQRKAQLIWRQSWETWRQAEFAIFEYINGFYKRDAVTQHWAGKALSLLKEKWPKRVLGAALKRDGSTFPTFDFMPSLTNHLLACAASETKSRVSYLKSSYRRRPSMQAFALWAIG